MTDESSPAVFVDRDGTIMRDADYCSDPEQVQIFAGVPEALRRLKSKGYKLIIITNQSGIGRGLITMEQYHAVETKVLHELGPDLIDATYFCPDVPGQRSNCRKPAPGMILRASREHRIDLSSSFFVGDKEIDAECVGARDVALLLDGVAIGYAVRCGAGGPNPGVERRVRR